MYVFYFVLLSVLYGLKYSNYAKFGFMIVVILKPERESKIESIKESSNIFVFRHSIFKVI